MASGDYMNLTFRNTTTYQPDGSFIPDGYIFTVSSNGRQNWTNSLRLDSLTVSTFTLNSTFIVASTNTNNMVIFSSLTVSSTDSRNLTYSTLRGDTIVTNNLTLNSNLNVGSTFASLVQTSTLLASTLQSLNGSLSSVVSAQLVASSIRTGAFFTQNATVASTLTTSTLNADNTSGRLASYDALTVSTTVVSSLLTASSLLVPGSVVYSTLSGSTLTTRVATVQSTLTVSTLLGSTLAVSTLTSAQAEVTQLSVPSTAAISTAMLQFANVSSLVGSTLTMRTVNFSTMAGSTLTLNTVVINSTLITSTFATGSLNFSTLAGSTIGANAATVHSTLTVSTTETQSLVVNRQPGTSANPAYKMLIDQGTGQNENALYITNSNYGSDQGLSIGMVNEGFSFFGSYAKIQGKRSGSAATTNLVLQSDAGKVGIGTTNPDALVDIYAPSGVPATLFLYNGAMGTNTTGSDLTLSVLNMGSSGSGLYFDSIRIRVPNGAATSATRMDFCTPAGTTDNTQTTRLSILPYTGFVGIGTTTPTDLLTVVGMGYGLVHTDGTVAVGSQVVSGTGLLGTKSNHPLGFFTNSLTTPQMTLATSGNVGVGTTTPGDRLTVFGTGYGFIHTNGTTAVGSFSNATMGLLGTKSAHPLGFFTNSATSTPQMTLLTSGYVGIGTTVPTNLLHIHSGSTNLAAIRLTSASTGWGSGMVFENTTATTGRTYGFYSDSTPGSFHLTDVTASADRMVIDSTGRVGIGTATPAALLDVNGGIISRQQSPAISMLGDVDGAKWLMKLGDFNLSFLSDNTGFTGFENVSAFSRTFRAAVQMLGTTGGMTIRGNVGVGTTDATYRMTILGSQPMNGTTTAVNPERIYGAIRPATGGVQNATSFALGLCGSTTAINPFGRLDLLVNGAPVAGNNFGFTPDVNVMSVIGNGTVGIGTTSPIDTLDVNGTLRVVNRAIFPGFNSSGTTYFPGVINLGGGYGPQIRSVYPNGTYTDSISLQFLTNIAYNNSTLTPRMHIAAVTGNVGINTTNPDYARFQVAGRGLFGFIPSSKTGVFIDNEDSYGGSPCIQAVSTGFGASPLVINPVGGNVGVGLINPSSRFHVKDGRMNLNVSRDPFTGLLAYTDANRAQFVLSSEYSDLVIGSSQINNLHGSTLTFASWNPNNSAEYRKWVINQGNWGSRLHMLEFGYSDNAYTNPHSYIDSTSTVVTMDGINKRVGIGSTNPAYKLDVIGSMRGSDTLLIGAVQSGFSQWGNIYSGSSGGNYIISNNGTITTFMGGDASGYGMVGTNTNHDFVIRTNNTERVRITAGGNMGVGTASPGSRLEVSGSTRITGSINLGSTDTNYDVAWSPSILMNCVDRCEIQIHDSGSRLVSMMYYNGDNRMFLGRDIGWGKTPVTTSTTLTVDSDLYVNSQIYVGPGTTGNAGINFRTVYDTGYLFYYGCCDGSSDAAFYFISSAGARAIGAGGFFGYPSDRRLKTNIHSLESSSCLDMIRQLNVCQFDFIDKEHGRNKSIGFIADEVKDILPDVVDQATKYLPNINEKIIIKRLEKDTIHIILTTWVNELQPDVRIKLIDPKTHHFYFGVIQTIDIDQHSINAIITDLPEEENEFTLYGTQVTDFKTICYNSISSMSVGAIKELYHENQQLKEQVSDLQSRLARIEELLLSRMI